jgi:hypothetical protein
MKPWRDIFSAETFQVMRKDKQYVGQSGAKTVFGGQSKEHHLKKLEEALRAYHALDKTSANLLDLRQNKLLQIHILASQWFTLFKIDKVQAAARSNNDKKGLDPTRQSLDRNILTLERRSLRKRDYLDKLKIYCRTAYPQALLDFLNSPRDGEAELLDLDRNVHMEREDFVHRDGYEDEQSLIHRAFEQWAQGNDQIPFFLWLENHEVCFAEKKGTHMKFMTQVEYFDDRTRVNPEAKFRIVTGPPLMCGDEICDTDRIGYVSGGQKSVSPNNTWGDGVAAFVWSAQNELFLCNHLPGKFHHSSLLSGQRVKSAGMIRIQNGMIVELSNDSGHYKPRIDHIVRFIDYYRSAISYWCQVRFTTGGDRNWAGTLNKFLADRQGIINRLRA